jgi:polysaccharide deacetylase family protein (PEP-CTERM system associated)
MSVRDASVPDPRAIVNAMTVDVEEHYHANVFDGTPMRDPGYPHESRVRSSTERMLALLDSASVRATFFILGKVADSHPALVREIASRGHEVASHGHAHQLVYTQSVRAFRDDVRRAKGTLESLVGAPVRGYRAPSYSIVTRSLWALDVLAEEGYEYDASIFPIRHDRYGIPGAPRHPHTRQVAGGTIVEAPPSTARAAGASVPVAGGGYFRLLPYGWTRWGLTRLNRVEQRPAIFYTHPWELDPGQPRLPLKPHHSIRHYANLEGTEGKLARLLREFRFGPLDEVLASLGLLSVAPGTRTLMLQVARAGAYGAMA